MTKTTPVIDPLAVMAVAEFLKDRDEAFILKSWAEQPETERLRSAEDILQIIHRHTVTQPPAEAHRTAGDVEVKPLEWRKPTDNPKDLGKEENVLCADGMGGVYAISHKQKVGPERLLWMSHDPFIWVGFGSIEEAKAAAQADYEARIRSALASTPSPQADGAEPLRFTYTNWRGETAQRAAFPVSVRYGTTEWHPEPGWLMLAVDAEKNAEREFAMADMSPPQADAPARNVDANGEASDAQLQSFHDRWFPVMQRMREALRAALEFVEDEAGNRAEAGSEYSDYEREPRDLADIIQAALASAPAPANSPVIPDGWSDIESAPKDEPVLVCDKGPFSYVAEWHAGSNGWLGADDAHWEPTHWRPLPAPPAKEPST